MINDGKNFTLKKQILQILFDKSGFPVLFYEGYAGRSPHGNKEASPVERTAQSFPGVRASFTAG